MPYFNYFPSINYEIEGSTFSYKQVKDILRRVAIPEAFRQAEAYTLPYIISDEDRPDTVSQNVYGRPDLHWLILIANEIHNPYFQWPLSNAQLKSHVREKYPGIAVYLKKSDALIADGEVVTYQGNQIGTVLRWNQTLLKLEIAETETLLPDYAIIKIGSTEYQIHRSELNSDSIHHFENAEGEELPPYLSVSSIDDYLKTRNDIVVGQSIIQSYIDPMVVEPIIQNLAVTNLVYEDRTNEARREIRVIRKNNVDTINKLMRKLIRGDE